MTLEIDIGVTKGDFSLDVAMTCAPGETVAVVGPNGAGKTTLLRAVAGLDSVDTGSVVVDGVVLNGLTPERRSVGLMFQGDALFPHLTASDNVAFGLRCQRVGSEDARARARVWLERVGLADVGDLKPAALSGGQAQRVALARALAPAPAVLLLDEPLAALDATARNEMRRLLRSHLAAFAGPRLLVTHDAVDASILADRVVVLDAGRVVQTGTPAELAARPRHRWVADLAVTNLFEGRIDRGDIALDQGGTLRAAATEATGAVFAAVSPRSVTLHRDRPEGSARNSWPGRVLSIEPVGPVLRVRIGGAPAITAEITAGAGDQLGLAEGVEVWVAVKATEIDVYPA